MGKKPLGRNRKQFRLPLWKEVRFVDVACSIGVSSYQSSFMWQTSGYEQIIEEAMFYED